MIVERHSQTVREYNQRGELAELFKTWAAIGGLSPRVYTSTYGQMHVVSVDLDFETEEDQKRFWAHITSTKEHAEVLEKLPDIVVPGTHRRELFQLH